MNYIKNRKIIIYLIISIVSILIIGGVIYFIFLIDKTIPEEIPEKSAEEKEIIKQLEELDALRQEKNIVPFSQEEQEEQLSTLNQLYEEKGSSVPSEEEMQKQLEELDKLRSKY